MQGGDNTKTIAAGLPNIAGKFEGDELFWSGASTSATGAFYIENSNKLGAAGGEGKTKRVAFNANRSSSIYGNSNTVQPPALCLIPQIRF